MPFIRITLGRSVDPAIRKTLARRSTDLIDGKPAAHWGDDGRTQAARRLRAAGALL